MVPPEPNEAETKQLKAMSLSSSPWQKANQPSVYHVGFPPQRKLVQDFADTMKETFFADDPLHPYKNQPKSRKFMIGLESLFPILKWGRDYKLSKFKGDLVAGLTIASLCIPQDIGYARLANMEPQNGLYTSFIPPLIYAIMGSSRDIAIGPVAVVSLLLGTLLGNELDPIKDKDEYHSLAFTATFFSGVTQLALGCLRLGFLIDYLSHPATVGFMAGAAITIALQQLRGLLGIKEFTTKTDIISVMESVLGSVGHGWNWQTIVIGSTFLAFLLAAKYIGRKNKRHFWVPAIAPIISVILSTTFVYITHAEDHGVKIVGSLKQGINPLSASKIHFTGPYAAKGFRIGVVAAMIALTEAISIGRTFAAMSDYQIDGNKEMVALGTMNIIGSMTSCYVATGSFSRSAVNYMAGCQTPVSNIVMSVVVFLTLEYLTPLFKFTPNVILSSIIISAVIGLVDYKAALIIWKIDKLDFIVCIGAFLGVIFKSVEIGLLIAVSISFSKILLQVTRPSTFILGKLPGTSIYRSIEQYPEATKVPGVVIFSNSNYLKERVIRWLRDEEENLKGSNLPRIDFLIIDMSSVTDIDTSGIHALEDLYKCLQKKEVQLILANPGMVVINKIFASGFTEWIGRDKFFLTVEEAVMTCSPTMREDA